ncbi:tetratricopeptide repeat-containing protein [Cardiosporidium cionae]|uniref:Tetratricopeptide repeat-containing protein n=1 Tax=Cardiosporidium cionae TaxID=476202 RepID=A0ABQ7JFM4_9APIC|nr:tetratricopeptide repeat-containing protein [Cardiosporidium cionae]|eukprot:KAF8822768.1 tetratricopeptide repeat-containing protein [Cardiosporidium cionae]
MLLHLFASRLFAPLPIIKKEFWNVNAEDDSLAGVLNYSLGGYCWETGCFKNCGLNIYRLIRRLSEVYYPCLRLPSALSKAIYNARLQAEYYYRHYDFETALSFCKYILAKDPFDWDILVIKCCCMLQLPIYYHGLTKLAAAMKRYHLHISCTWFTDGCAALASSRYLKAIESFMRVLRMDPHFAECVMAVGHAHSLRGNSDNATLFYHSVARLQPLNYRAFLYLGMEELKAAECSGDNFTQLERLNRAEMYFTLAHELNSDDPFVQNEFGAMANARGRFELAASWFAKAVQSSSQICGKLSLFQSNLGYARLRFGSFKCAAEAFYSALKIDGQDFHSWLGLAVALYQLGQHTCIFFFEKAVGLSPEKNDKAVLLWNLAVKDYNTYTPSASEESLNQPVANPSVDLIMRENLLERHDSSVQTFSEKQLFEDILQKCIAHINTVGNNTNAGQL